MLLFLLLLMIQVICMPMYVIQTNSLYLQQKGNLHQTLNNKVNHNQKVIHIDLIYFYIEYIVDLFPRFILFSQYFFFSFPYHEHFCAFIVFYRTTYWCSHICNVHLIPRLHIILFYRKSTTSSFIKLRICMLYLNIHFEYFSFFFSPHSLSVRFC